MKCLNCGSENIAEKFNIIGISEEQGLCRECSEKGKNNKDGICSCCDSKSHTNAKDAEARCEDYCHKTAEGIMEHLIKGDKLTDEMSVSFIRGLGCINPCPCYEKYLKQILEPSCKYCGGYCVKESETTCDYIGCGGEKGRNNGICRFKKTCEDFGKGKEETRKTYGKMYDKDSQIAHYEKLIEENPYNPLTRSESSDGRQEKINELKNETRSKKREREAELRNWEKDVFYKKEENKPKNGFNCSYALEYYPHEFIQSTSVVETQEERLRLENEAFQERIRELEQLLTEAKIEVPPKR